MAKEVEKRRLRLAGMEVEMPVRLVGGVVASVLVAGKTMEWEPKVMGEVARPKDEDMDRWRGIEMERGTMSGCAEAAPLAVEEDVEEDVEKERWWWEDMAAWLSWLG